MSNPYKSQSDTAVPSNTNSPTNHVHSELIRIRVYLQANIVGLVQDLAASNNTSPSLEVERLIKAGLKSKD